MKRISLSVVLAILLNMAGGCAGPHEVDVLVVGGGASGVCAGVQAARMGVNTLIVEQTPWLGGMLTSAGVSCIDGNYNLRSGLFGEFADSLSARYGGWDALKTGWVSHINYEPHVGQDILSDIVSKCAPCLSVRRETEVVEISGEEGNWLVRTESSQGSICTYRAKVLIDATELGDVAKVCGVEYRIGMDASSDTGESIAPQVSNDVIQDLTFVAVLKDYGPDADMTVERPEEYDPSMFYNCAINKHSTVAETGQTLWPVSRMVTYGALQNGKFMINWPIYGNDYYVNSIEMDHLSREEAYRKARNFTMCFVYFIQTELGMKNLGLADDEFPTEDLLPFIPYHRESRRIYGEAFFTVDAAALPYEYVYPYYRTGIAVGDYAVDHHHFRHPDWRNLPDLHFYPIPSFSVPLGVIIPKNVDGLIVAEKSVSVSNLVNGATRLQPVVMQLGQAAGALAALAVIDHKTLRQVGVRQVQNVLLSSGCYIMPYLDLPSDHRHFEAVQRIGATGILRAEGRNVGWANQTWMRLGDSLIAEEIFLDEYYPDFPLLETGLVTVGGLIEWIKGAGFRKGVSEELWASVGLSDYELSRVATRMEAAVLIDALLDPFNRHDVDYSGRLFRP